jgi:glycosyltransferase involved in cell wall biosynthesis
MKKILYVTDVFPPHCGGSGWSVYFFARGLRNNGFDVKVVSLDDQPRVYEGFKVESLPLSRSKVPFLTNFIRENQDLPKISERLTALAGDFDILHGHHRFSSVALALSAPRKFFTTIRDYWPICFCSRSIYRTGTTCTMTDFGRCSGEENTWKGIASPLVYPWFEARLSRWNAAMRKAEKIFCISNYLKDQLLPVFNENQLSVLPNFSEEIPANGNVSVPEKFILYIGRFEKNKGAHLLPEIMQKSKVRLPLVLVGEGTLRDELEREFMARSMNVHFTGYLPYPEMLQVMKKSEFVLFTSIWPEPLGRVLIEAGMLRKAVITFGHSGGHHDVVENEVSGLMANAIDDFAASVARLAADSKLTNALGENARKLYDAHFSPDAVIPQLLHHYSVSLR